MNSLLSLLQFMLVLFYLASIVGREIKSQDYGMLEPKVLYPFEHTAENVNADSEKCVQIAIPFILKQMNALVENISWWKRQDIPPCKLSSKEICIDISFVLDVSGSKNKKGQLPTVYEKYVFDLLKEEVLKLHVESPAFSQCTRSIHLIHFLNGTRDYKLGAYMMAKNLVLNSMELNYAAMALMETDAFPVFPGWMNQIYEYAFSNDFLVKGSAMKEHDPSKAWINGHINGNCMWRFLQPNIISKSFMWVDDAVSNMNRTLGYDVLINLLFVKSNDENFDCSQSFRSDHCDFALNFVKDQELKQAWRHRYLDVPYIYNQARDSRPDCFALKSMSEDELHSKYGQYLFVHCGHQTK